ncbi:long tail fiber protein proximal connector [Serratia phage 92A1]|nr:long tail fiber protein proximal connector [Serratia phage 92A1]
MAFDNKNNAMAFFDDTSVTTQAISENNSVKYKLTVCGANHNSSPLIPFVNLNDKKLSINNFTRGLNCIVMDSTLKVVSEKSFDLFDNTASASTSFIEFINSLAPGLVVSVVSYDAIRSTVALDDFMKSIGSNSWPGTELLMKFYRSSAAFIYLTTEKAIAIEDYALTGAGGLGDQRVTIEAVFDSITDIGATGLTGFYVSDPETYKSDQYLFKKYRHDKLVDCGLSKGDILLCAFDIYTPQNVWDQASGQGRCRVSLNFTKGEQFIDGIPTMNTKPNTWERFEIYVTLPTNRDYDSLLVQAYRFPQNVSSGEVQVKNMSVSKVTRAEKTIGNAAIGVYGIRMTSATEIAPPNPGTRRARLLNLPVKDNPGKVHSVSSENFKEFQ